MVQYFDSLEEVDAKSDMFRFPFEDEFLSKYRDKFLDNVDVANNLFQAFSLVKKGIQEGTISEEDKFEFAACLLPCQLGMYRGSSFLVQKDYKVHIPVVVELLKLPYNCLFGLPCVDLWKKEVQEKLTELDAL